MIFNRFISKSLLINTGHLIKFCNESFTQWILARFCTFFTITYSIQDAKNCNILFKYIRLDGKYKICNALNVVCYCISTKQNEKLNFIQLYLFFLMVYIDRRSIECIVYFLRICSSCLCASFFSNVHEIGDLFVRDQIK